MTKEPLYKIKFVQQDEVCEIYARYLCEDSLMGFIEIEELVFSQQASSVLVDTREEKLKAEFNNVKRTYLPMHTVLRIDEIYQEGEVDLDATMKNNSNISHLPFSTNTVQPDKES